jgi:exodeoxyribonuclease V alpha subunit
MLFMDKYVIGNVRKVIFESNAGLYKVGILKLRETNIEELNDYVNRTITFTGNFNEINKEIDYKFYGEVLNHSKYGLQFNVSTYEINSLDTLDGIVMYLSSGLFKGIGIKTAKKIVDKLGRDTINIIKNDFVALLSILGEDKAKELSMRISELESSQEDMIKLNSLGFNNKESLDLLNKYHSDIGIIIDENIYVLSEEVNFLKLDLIYLSTHDEFTSLRIKEVIKHIIKELCYKNADTYVTKENLYLNVNKYLKNKMTLEIFLDYLDMLKISDEIFTFDDNVMLKSFYDTEKYIADRLIKLNSIKSKYNEKTIKNEIDAFEVFNNIELHKDQSDAIYESFKNNIFIISGGPGTGKTTIIKALVNIYKNIYKENIDSDIALLAPTGRSARRMSESVLHKAVTIHKFLKWNKEDKTFQLNEENKSNAKFVIIDEFSMVDIFLFSSLLEALRYDVKLILIGDANQLPSISPGNVLEDLLNTKVINKKFLNYIYRVESGSYIIDLANKIKNRELLKIEKNKDYEFIEAKDEEINDKLIDICNKFKMNNSDLSNFQVLIPMYKGLSGIDNTNTIMQGIFNNLNKEVLKVGDITYKKNDKVIQLINDVDNNIYNGDIGFINKINSDDSIEVDFSGNMVNLTKDFDNISLAYAISVHKSQGSEYDYVVLIISSYFKRMLYNKLLYTGVTRAKKKLIIIGSIDYFNEGINTLYSSKRLSYLKNLFNV